MSGDTAGQLATFFGVFGLLGVGGCAALVGADFDRDERVESSESVGAGDDRAAGDGGAIGEGAREPVPGPVPPRPDGTCEADRKLCGGLCASHRDPSYGCDPASCAPCPAPANATAVCGAERCDFVCNDGFTRHGGVCEADDDGARTLSAGRDHTCAVDVDGAVVCWGWNGLEQASPPTGSFKSVSAGSTYSCGVRTNGTVACWGAEDVPPPAGLFRSVSVHAQRACGLRTDRTLVCWGHEADNEAPPPGTFKNASISRGSYGVTSDGTIAFWDDANVPPSGSSFRSVDAGVHYGCALRFDGSLVCWGANANGQSTAPSGVFQRVSVNRFVASNESSSCWLDDTCHTWHGAHTCALKADGTVGCWGSNKVGQSTAPAGTFRDVAAGSTHSCAVRLGGSVVCWGDDTWGQRTPPAGLVVHE